MKIVNGTLLGTLLEHFLKENYFQQIYGNAYQLELQTKWKHIFFDKLVFHIAIIVADFIRSL